MVFFIKTYIATALLRGAIPGYEESRMRDKVGGWFRTLIDSELVVRWYLG